MTSEEVVRSRVALILRNSEGAVTFREGETTHHLGAGGRVVGVHHLVRDLERECERISEPLDVLKALYSGHPTDLQRPFWTALELGLTPNSAHVVAHGLLELDLLLPILGSVRTRRPDRVETTTFFWNAIRAKLTFESSCHRGQPGRSRNYRQQPLSPCPRACEANDRH